MREKFIFKWQKMCVLLLTTTSLAKSPYVNVDSTKKLILGIKGY